MIGTTVNHAMNETLTRAVDIVFVVDMSLGHDGFLKSFRKNFPGFLSRLQDKLTSNKRISSTLRVKITWFRDFYFDGSEAYGESPFFLYPNEKDKIESFISTLRCAGGGDLPESSMEALTLALRSDFSQVGDIKNHIVILVSDEEAHPLQNYTKLAKIALRQGRVPIQYPPHMPGSVGVFGDAWINHDPEGYFGTNNEHTKLDFSGKWLFLGTPCCYPWDDIEVGLDCVVRIHVREHGGCGDFNWEELETYFPYALDYREADLVCTGKEPSFVQGSLDSSSPGISEKDVELSVVIDTSLSMGSVMDKVKDFVLSLPDAIFDVQDRLRQIINIQCKVAWFNVDNYNSRYTYCESPLYELPDDNSDFYHFVSSISPQGSIGSATAAMDATVRAMQASFATDKNSRKIVILFTDALYSVLSGPDAGHPDMLGPSVSQGLKHLFLEWNSIQNTEKRLLLFAPPAQPWSDIEVDFSNTLRQNISDGFDLDTILMFSIIAELDE